VLVDRKRRPYAAPLRHVADALLGDDVGGKPEDFFPRELDAPARPDKAGDRVAQRGLAHAVAADHRQHALVQPEGHVLQGMRPAVIDVEVLDLEDQCRTPM
jgi:hypothetical protein